MDKPQNEQLSPRQLAQLKHQELQLHQNKLKIIEGLPHKFGWKFYKWARLFYESLNKICILCAANQISKSSTQIRKCIEWATNQSLWPKLWKTRPQIFLYLYPSRDVATIEFEKKWVTEFLPRGEFKAHPIYGWKEEYSNGYIHAIHFFSGVSVYFKVYTQDPQTLQTNTAHAIFTDEELPVDLFAELQFRLAATDGYFNMVYTATLCQDFWRRAVERIGFEDETLVGALKLQLSMYDCLIYEDGTPGAYSEERIKRIIATCPTDAEVQRRVFGKHISESGRVISTFNPDKHMIKPIPLKEALRIYSGVDVGSGGATGHPAAITFVGVEPDHRKGYVFRGWRGDNIQTSSSDIIEKWASMKGPLYPILNHYDFASKDFHIVATRMGYSFQKADKTRKTGEDLLNTLFRNDMLFIFDDGELVKLSTELMSLMKGYNPISAKNNFYDSLRYAVMGIPWDFSHLTGSVDFNIVEKEIESRPLTKEELLEYEMEERWRGFGKRRKENTEDDAWEALNQELDYWNEESGN